MKKNLFLLLSVYCFVIQPVLAGILRGEVNFYYFAGVNIIFITLITMLYFSAQRDMQTASDLETKKHNEEVTRQSSVQQAKKNRKKAIVLGKSYLLWLVFVVVLLWICITALYLYQMFSLELSILLGLVSGYLWFVILCSLFALKVKHWFFRGFSYLLLVGAVALLWWLIYKDLNSMWSHIKNMVSSVHTYTQQWFDDNDNNSQDTMVVASGDVVNVVINTPENGKVVSWTMITWSLLSWKVLSWWTITWDSREIWSEEERPFPELSLDTKLTMIQVIRYLLEKNGVILDHRQSIPFTYVDYDSDDYTYFKTAYRKGLIGKNTKPDALVSCDIYIVMKGLLEQWDVNQQDKKNDIKQAYWNKAQNLEQLGSCQQGEKLTVVDL